MKQTMFNNYVITSAARAYIVGFALAGRAYMARMDELCEDMVKLDRESTSHGGAYKLRMALTNAVKVRLMESGAVELGSVEEVLSGRKNKGEAFEKFITEYYGQSWVKDSVPYYMDGDITVNGEKIQIKWENASLTNENVIRKAIEWKLTH